MTGDPQNNEYSSDVYDGGDRIGGTSEGDEDFSTVLDDRNDSTGYELSVNCIESFEGLESSESVFYSVDLDDGGAGFPGSGGGGGVDRETVVEFSAEVFSVVPGTTGTGSVSVQNRLNQEWNVSVTLPESSGGCEFFGLEDTRQGETGYVSSGMYRLPSASGSFTEGSRSIGVSVDMPDETGNETLECEAVTKIETSGVSDEAGDLVLRAEPGTAPFSGLRGFFGSLGSGSVLDDVAAFLFYLLQGVRGLVVITGFFGLVAPVTLWLVRRYM